MNMFEEKKMTSGKERSPTEERPLITFALFAYNQERYICEAVESAFSQTYSPLEIILSDDHSSDRTFEIMQEMAEKYSGPHEIILNKNKENKGLRCHFNRLTELASGEIILCAAGDDISLPERTEISWEVLRDHPDAACVSLRSDTIDAEGELLQVNSLSKKKRYCEKHTIKDYLSSPSFHLNGASRAFRKSVHDTFGPLGSCGAEDSTTLLRCLMIGNAYDCGATGVRYRVHGSNISAGGNIHQFDHEPVFKQWLRDIEFAASRGLVSSRLASRLKKQARRRLMRRRLESSFFLSDHKIGFLISHIIWSDSFTMGQKYRMVRKELYQAFGR